MAVRKVVTRSGRTVRGYFPSRKMGTMIPWESLLERDAILLLEFSPEVLKYRGQPARVPFQLNGVIKHCIPDFEVEFTDGLISHIEVKPAKKLAKPEIAIRYAAIRAHYETTDIWYQILTEKELRNPVRLENFQLLGYHLPRPEDEFDLMDAQQKLLLLPTKTVAGAAAVLGDIKMVYRLIAANYLICNFDQPISPSTSISYRFKGEDHDATVH